MNANVHIRVCGVETPSPEKPSQAIPRISVQVSGKGGLGPCTMFSLSESETLTLIASLQEGLRQAKAKCEALDQVEAAP
ncbi:MAG: hypothetical protein GAK28_02428 [Luteibacter sp.]|uniref:hypothetical protein n=1 Tax=Luteibacter sp. TaxID=1886636 RepID=UPI00138275F2|nr:hypothetical protein [Luteibacter sp.]KAF1006752.1 MAG: hypothetical protein GAK28_02428 [Luteibacter sp.]